MNNLTSPAVRRGITITAAALAAALTLGGCATTGSGGDGLTEVVFAQPTPQSVIFWPSYVADELGYFEEEGIRITLAPSAEISMAAFVTNGSALISNAGASEVLFAAREGADVAVIMDWSTRSAEGVYVLEDSPVKDAAGLTGTIVGVQSDEDRAFVIAALGAVDVAQDDVEFVIVGAGGASVANALREGKIDAYSGPTSEAAALEAAGVDMRDITPEEVAQTPAGSMMVTRTTLNEKKDLITGFLRAWAKATHAAFANPEAFKAMSKKVVPDEWRDEAAGKNLMEAVLKNNQPDDMGTIGEVRMPVWKTAQAQLIDVGELSAEQDLSAILDDSLIAAANTFDRAEVEKNMNDWLKANS